MTPELARKLGNWMWYMAWEHHHRKHVPAESLVPMARLEQCEANECRLAMELIEELKAAS